MATGDFIAYYRVSTKRQGASGLGLEAQRESVRNYLNGGNWRLLEEFTEIESGKKDDRPMLEEALKMCRLTNAKLIVAKLDRLSRNLEFLARLQSSKTKFVCADMPEANELTIHIMAAMAQHERQVISKRVKEALAIAKERGTVLGNPRLSETRPTDLTEANKQRQENYSAYLKDIRPVIEDIRKGGITSLLGIANELNRRGFQTRRGKKWTAQQVKNYTELPK
jgi:DNA invertase Pin-like site-specific DNA recombinase